MPFIFSFSLKMSLQSYHDMGFFFLQPRLLPIFRITFMDVRKISSPRNPLYKPITTAAVKYDTSLFRIFASLFHYMSQPTNRSVAISPVTPKSCFLINIIRSLYNNINFPNHGPRVGHSVSVNFLPSLAKMHTSAPYRLAHAIGDFLM